jgi:hypothetical protein
MKSWKSRIALALVVSCGWSAVELAQAGGPWSSGEDAEDWYAARSTDPPGARQRLWKGKLWPPIPRPTGRTQLPIHRYHSAHYWPHPYNCQDQEYVRALSQSQVNNGWVQATTLFDYHFDEETHQLNRSGRIQLRWILETTSPTHRRAFVQAGGSTEVSQARLESVKTEAVSMVGAENVPPVLLRIASPDGRAARELNKIHEMQEKSTPKPRITNPLRNDAATVGSSSGGGSQ